MHTHAHHTRTHTWAHAHRRTHTNARARARMNGLCTPTQLAGRRQRDGKEARARGQPAAIVLTMYARRTRGAHPALRASIVCTRPKRLDMRSPTEEKAALAAGMRTKTV